MVQNTSARCASTGPDIILGGLGTLGLLVAEWLVRNNGSRSVHLVGRRGHMTPAVQHALESSLVGASITLTMCDTSMQGDIAALVSGAPFMCLAAKCRSGATDKQHRTCGSFKSRLNPVHKYISRHKSLTCLNLIDFGFHKLIMCPYLRLIVADTSFHTVFHAGGTLADATLANQTPSGLRAAFAPKLASFQRWMANSKLQPTADQVHVTPE